MKLFGQESTYLYGRILNRKFIAPSGSYEIEPLNMASGMHPVRYNGKIEVFYVSPIFNSYLVSREENVNVLFSVDGKVTITNDEVDKDVLYTFRVVRETDDLRVAEIYKFDTFYPGFKTTGEVKWKKDNDGRMVYNVETRYGSGTLLLQNNDVKGVVSVVLYKKDKQLHFVQVDDPVSGVLKMTVVSAVSGNSYGVRNGNIRGFLVASNGYKAGDTVECVVRRVGLGNYMFAEYAELKIGSTIEARVKDYGRDRIYLEYEGHEGYMMMSESARKRYGEYVRGVLYDIKDGVFLMSTKRTSGLKEAEEGVNLSVPFDISDVEDESSSTVEEDEGSVSKSLNAERKRSKAVTEEDILMDIRAHPGEAMPVIKYIQYKIEIGEEGGPGKVFYEFLPKIEGEEKDKLCISFVNYLMFVKDTECLKTIRRLAKICSPRFLDVVASNTDDIQVLKFYFEKTNTKKSFRMYLDVLFKADKEEAMRLVEKHKEFLSISIGMIYKYCDSPRAWVEKLLVDKKDVWISYIRNEKGAYLRSLYRRVVDKKWKVSDMKEFYKMWLEYEKENNGNVEEVKLRAKEYVESVKNKSHP
ncbi:hypothetical protein EHEL_060540 [Encephalitozoon hellem ATCC 50504]|uniref:Uncharacterized protein n=1 Tax=Encephalitozoon hellem TaxID=27973 RepID=A0A9Q9C3B0_ENCHE|nr:uncharacterized protein EHEL_060540 [Encephalitozoon hellem ATCC 50504]AFM98427.1 hypothetical protein EHEL_060540 [Encephalitozoon hellem ATCC 50504]UTX43351.1 hypothetical protein GPU96_06g10980 [Encephalitozoon hellem]|eukprot:XP_003887408.1 hypothetical protein EHEL_060540 [Encephalitozoon hellem ATCC 50504]